MPVFNREVRKLSCGLFDNGRVAAQEDFGSVTSHVLASVSSPMKIFKSQLLHNLSPSITDHHVDEMSIINYEFQSSMVPLDSLDSFLSITHQDPQSYDPTLSNVAPNPSLFSTTSKLI